MPNSTTTPPHSPSRFAKGLNWWVNFYETNSITVNGLENIEVFKPMTKGKVIIVTPHERDSDVTIPAATLLNHKHIQNIYPFAIKIANSSTHHHLLQDPLVNIGITLLGKENFYPIDYKKGGGQWKAKQFNKENFEPMIQDILSDKNDVLIALYGPPPKDQAKTERKPGIGAVYLAQMTHAPILPVKITYAGNTRKPDATVIFGKPFFITGTEIEKEILRKKAETILQTVL